MFQDRILSARFARLRRCSQIQIPTFSQFWSAEIKVLRIAAFELNESFHNRYRFRESYQISLNNIQTLASLKAPRPQSFESL